MAGETETVGGASAPSAALRDEILRVLGAERCPAFYAQRGEPCDGMEGCARCLGAAADVVLEVVSEHVAALAARPAAAPAPTPDLRDALAELHNAVLHHLAWASVQPYRGLVDAAIARAHGALAASGPGAAQTDDEPTLARMFVAFDSATDADGSGATRDPYTVDDVMCGLLRVRKLFRPTLAGRGPASAVPEACDNPFGRDAARRRVRAS